MKIVIVSHYAPSLINFRGELIKVLAAAMMKMMALPEAERQAMGRAGRAHIEANYSLERVVDQWEGLYRELLQKKGFSLSDNL